MRFGNDRCEANRVAKTITDLSQVVDYSESSLKMLYFPDWKPVHREKWVDKVKDLAHNRNRSISMQEV
jgi:hypothetical protein